MRNIYEDLIMLDSITDRALIPKLVNIRREPKDAMVRRVSTAVWERGIDKYLAEIAGARKS